MATVFDVGDGPTFVLPWRWYAELTSGPFAEAIQLAIIVKSETVLQSERS